MKKIALLSIMAVIAAAVLSPLAAQAEPPHHGWHHGPAHRHFEHHDHHWHH